jgi:hypothetical protein
MTITLLATLYREASMPPIRGRGRPSFASRLCVSLRRSANGDVLVSEDEAAQQGVEADEA